MTDQYGEFATPPENDLVDYAIQVVEGVEEFPEELSDQRMDQIATFLATRTFTRFVQEEDAEGEDGDAVLLQLIHVAISAAYVAGALDVLTQPNPTETLNVSGKSGNNVTINIY